MEVRRSALFVALMVVVGGALFFLIVASLFTIPLFALARFTEPSRGTDREWFRDGLRWAILGGGVVAVIGAAALGWWVRKGGKFPQAPRPWETE